MGRKARKGSVEGVSIGSIQVPGGDVSVGPEVWTCELRAARLPFRSVVCKDWEVLNSLLLIDCQAGQHEGLQSLVWSRQPGEPI